MNESFGKKFPKAHEKSNYYFDYCSEVWMETFPQTRSIAKNKID